MPEDPLNGYLEFDNYTHATFTCNLGFNLIGEEMISCEESGLWEKTPRCAPGVL